MDKPSFSANYNPLSTTSSECYEYSYLSDDDDFEESEVL